MKLGEVIGLAAVALAGYYLYEHYYGSSNVGVTVNTATTPQAVNTTPTNVTGEGTAVTAVAPSRMQRANQGGTAIQSSQVPTYLVNGRLTTNPNAVIAPPRRR